MSRHGSKFLVVDDHALVRHGFALALRELYPDAEVHEAGTLLDALAACDRVPDLDLVLYDLNLGPENALAGMTRMIGALDGVPLIVISASDDPAMVAEALRAGAKGYILKTGSSDILEHAVSLVLSGDTYVPIPRAALGGTVAREPARPVPSAGSSQLVESLTDRQRDVFNLLLAGCSNKEIARELGVLEGTVKVHVRAIMQKLGVRNRTQVAVVAARCGFLTEEG